MPCSFTPLTRKIVRGVLVLRTWLRKVSCRFCARSAALVFVPPSWCFFLLNRLLLSNGASPDRRPTLRSPSGWLGGTIRGHARFLGKPVRASPARNRLFILRKSTERDEYSQAIA